MISSWEAIHCRTKGLGIFRWQGWERAENSVLANHAASCHPSKSVDARYGPSLLGITPQLFCFCFAIPIISRFIVSPEVLYLVHPHVTQADQALGEPLGWAVCSPNLHGGPDAKIRAWRMPNAKKWWNDTQLKCGTIIIHSPHHYSPHQKLGFSFVHPNAFAWPQRLPLFSREGHHEVEGRVTQSWLPGGSRW